MDMTFPVYCFREHAVTKIAIIIHDALLAQWKNLEASQLKSNRDVKCLIGSGKTRSESS